MDSTPITAESRPRLRESLAAAPGDGPDSFVLHDPQRVAPGHLVLTRLGIEVIQLLDGGRSLREVSRVVPVPVEGLIQLAGTLDAGLFLEGPAVQAYLNGPVRRPSCIGCYPPEPAAIRERFRKLFTDPGGPGVPEETAKREKNLRAVLVPHMDYARGGVTYGWGFKELVERTDASLFVIIGTSHYSPERFTLTRMNFATPLGEVTTEQSYVDRLVQHYGPGLFDDTTAHLPEHSIELEVILLQYLLKNRRPFRIVPLLVGSFADCIHSGQEPSQAPDILRMVAALQSAEREAGEKVCYIISGDLAHIGPKFDDPDPVAEPFLAFSRSQDESILGTLNQADENSYFRVIEREKDARRICGLPPTWLTLAVAKPGTGCVLNYGRYVHPTGHESVSFAAAAFYE